MRTAGWLFGIGIVILLRSTFRGAFSLEAVLAATAFFAGGVYFTYLARRE